MALHNRTPSLIVIVLTLAAVLACGPTAEYHAEPEALSVSQHESTPEPCPHVEGTYPKLDDILADLVGKYERCELSEEEAAAAAPAHYGNTVLAEIDGGTRAGVKALDAWMGQQFIEPRHVLAEWEIPAIYAFVQVSQLGALSNQESAIKVEAVLRPEGTKDITAPVPAGVLGQAAEDPKPSFPTWLQGDVPSPGYYPKLKGVLGSIQEEYTAGTLDLKEYAENSIFGCYIEGDKVVGYLYAPDDAAVVRLQKSLSTAGVEWSEDVLEEGEFRIFSIRALPSQLIGIATLPDLVKVDQGHCGGVNQIHEGNPMDADTFASAFGPVESEAVAVIGADDWQDFTRSPFTGAGIKIGVIDDGFKGIDAKIRAGELPRPEAYYCFNGAFDTDVRPHQTRARQKQECELMYSHGLNVAESVMDVAPGAKLYLSNGGLDTNSVNSRERLTNAVAELIKADVDVIVHSISWSYTEGPGDGRTVWGSSDIHKAVKDATGYNSGYDGALWVNAAGNSRKSVWRDAPEFDAGTTLRLPRHQWLNQETRMFIRNPDGTYFPHRNVGINTAVIYVRWDDTWNGADCDLNLNIYHLDGNGRTTRLANRFQGDHHQSGRSTHKPYEVAWVDRALPGRYYLELARVSCSNSNLPSYIQVMATQQLQLDLRTSSGLGSITEPSTSQSEGLLSVGAAHFATPRTIQDYSARGPTTDGRIKPDVVGYDCASTSGLTYRTASCGFGGTSQAAPHVAGAAALVKQRFNHMNARQLAYYLKENTAGSPSPGNIWGHGRVVLPPPGHEVFLTGLPTQVGRNTSNSYTLNSVGSSSRVKIVANSLDSPGKVYFGNCPSSGRGLSESNNKAHGATIFVFGCETGKTQLHFFRDGRLLGIQNIEVSNIEQAPAPTNVTIHGCGKECLSVSWQGITPGIKQHWVQYRLKGFTSWNNARTDLPAHLRGYRITSGIKCGREYEVRVGAHGDGIAYTNTISMSVLPGSNRTSPCPPSFSRTSVSHSVEEDTAVGTGLVQVRASGEDVSHSITDGNVDEAFAIGDTTGWISLAKALDPDVRPRYLLTITAVERNADDPSDAATAKVAINVVERIEAPVATGTINSQAVEEGNSVPVDASPYFTGNVDRYSAISSRTSVATVSVRGNTVTVRGVDTGTATVTVTAHNSAGSASQTFQVTVREPIPPPTRVGSLDGLELNISQSQDVELSIAFSGVVDSYSGRSSNPGVATVSISGSTASVTGVSAGTTTITVTARNTAGTATQTLQITVVALPKVGAPTGVAVSASRTTADVSWDPVAGAAKYRVEYRLGASGAWSVSSDEVIATSHQVSGLVCDNKYQFRVGAHGDGTDTRAAWGSPSTVSADTLCLQPPAQPTGLKQEAGYRFIDITWDDPNDPGITKYQHRVNAITQGGAWGEWQDMPESDATTVAYTVANLDSGHAYGIQIRAVNVAGPGPHSAMVAAFVRPAPPPAPQRVLAGPNGPGSIYLRWIKVSDPQVTGYQYQWLRSDRTEWNGWTEIPGSNASTDGHTIENLAIGFTYRIEVRAVADDRDGEASDEVSVRLPPLPDAPTGLSGTATPGKIALSWTESNDASIVRYEYRVYPSDETDWQPWTHIQGSQVGTTTHTVTGLKAGVTYKVELRAGNVSGIGEASDDVSVAVPYPMPNAPTGLTATAGDGSITLNWTNPNDPGIDSYEMRIKAASTSEWGAWTGLSGTSATSTTATITGLTNGTAYSLQIRAANSSGQSGPSAEVTATPAADA